MVVDRQAIRTLLETIKYTPAGCKEVLETLLGVLPLIEAGEEEQAIEAIAQAERERDSIFSKAGSAHIDYMRRIIRELDHYKDRRTVIETALASVESAMDVEDRLQSMLPDVKAAWARLDAKTLAVLEVFHRLMSLSGEANIDYLNELLEIEGDPKILRGDPAFETILQAYDLAEEYLAAVQ